MSLKFERKLPVIFFFVFLMLTTIGFVFYQNTVSLQEAINREKKSQALISTLDETLTLALDLESGMSAFVITGSETYLDPYNRAKPKIVQNIAKLRQAIADNPAQAAESSSLENALNEFAAETARKVDLRKRDGYEAAISEVPNSKGRLLLAQIRASIERLKNEEIRIRQQREQDLDQRLYRTIWILIISSIAGIVFLGLANLSVLSEIKKRRFAQDALVDANRNLEERIDVRTNELQNANEKLREIAGERESLLLNEQSARREAEIANRLRDEFMATVSHELRTPLNSILAWARMLKNGTLDSDQSKKAVVTIIKNSETQNRLIEDLLDVARLISGKLVLDFKAVDPLEILRHSINTVMPAANLKQIEIDLDAKSLPHGKTMRGDRDRLVQVFSNLLTNAIKFSPENTRVTVSVELSNGFVEIKIRDTGFGISSDLLPVVFERFRQDTVGTGKNAGLGLGLAIVRNLVELHGGSVKAESEGENKGSVFSVILPVIDAGN